MKRSSPLFIGGLMLIVVLNGVAKGGAEEPTPLMVQFHQTWHFLTPSAEDVEVGPGMYQVEAAESWLKLLPEGESRSAAVLLEATQGNHEETLTEPVVRAGADPDNPDVFHLAMLLSDGSGLEAIGTKSGIRLRGFNLAFVNKFKQSSRRFTQRPRVKQKSSPPIALQPGLTLPKLEGKVVVPPPRPQPSCGPSHEFIPGSVLTDGPTRKDNWASQASVAVFQNQLHVVAGITQRCKRGKTCGFRVRGSQFAHFKFNGKDGLRLIINKKGA